VLFTSSPKPSVSDLLPSKLFSVSVYYKDISKLVQQGICTPLQIDTCSFDILFLDELVRRMVFLLLSFNGKIPSLSSSSPPDEFPFSESDDLFVVTESVSSSVYQDVILKNINKNNVTDVDSGILASSEHLWKYLIAFLRGMIIRLEKILFNFTFYFNNLSKLFPIFIKVYNNIQNTISKI
jgi:hypothetical protein